jgi:hypothetical protein
MQDAGYREIPLLNGHGEVVGHTKVSPEDFEALSQWRWAMKDGNYVVRRATYYLHREIMGLVAGDGLSVDHINGDGLDNRRGNLRAVTQGHNCQNVPSKPGSTSPYRGVSWSKQANKWQAQCTVNGENNYLGYFDDELEAARVAAEFRREYLPYSVER